MNAARLDKSQCLKTCSQCKENKPSSEFFSNGVGLLSFCKKCYYNKYRNQRNAINRKFRQSNKYKLKHREESLRQHDKYFFGGNRLLILEREKHICPLCREKAEHVHHVDGNGRNQGKKAICTAQENLIALCHSCHARYHTYKRYNNPLAIQMEMRIKNYISDIRLNPERNTCSG